MTSKAVRELVSGSWVTAERRVHRRNAANNRQPTSQSTKAPEIRALDAHLALNPRGTISFVELDYAFGRTPHDATR
jgi:hypothetical protein